MANGKQMLQAVHRTELYALGYRADAKKLENIDDFLSDVQICEFDEECARTYGRIHAQLAERGIGLGRADSMIAATALVQELVLVTHDRDFDPVVQVLSELQLMDWLDYSAGPIRFAVSRWQILT